MNQILSDIAKKYLGFKTLETRKSDSLDFKEVACWNALSALEAAYKAGEKSVTNKENFEFPKDAKFGFENENYIFLTDSFIPNSRVPNYSFKKKDGYYAIITGSEPAKSHNHQARYGIAIYKGSEFIGADITTREFLTKE